MTVTAVAPLAGAAFSRPRGDPCEDSQMTAIEPSSSPASRNHWLVVLTATVTGVAFVMAVASLTFGGESGLLIVRPIAHPILYGLIFAVAMAVTVLIARTRTRAALAAAAVGTMMLVMLMALWHAWGSDWEEPDRSYRSPDGRHVLIVDSTSAYIDPLWNLRLEETSGLTARYWSLGCVNGDFDELTSVRWVTSHELAFNVDAGEKHVTIDSHGPGPVDQALRSC